MSYKPPSSSVVPDSYIVMAKLPRRARGFLGMSFEEAAEAAEARERAGEKMVRAIRRLAKKEGADIRIETEGLLASGIAKVKCDRYFARQMEKLSSVYQVEQERFSHPSQKGPRPNV